MFGPLQPAAFLDRLPPERIDPTYRRLRREVFVGIFIGYAAFYLVRNNLALAIPKETIPPTTRPTTSGHSPSARSSSSTCCRTSTCGRSR